MENQKHSLIDRSFAPVAKIIQTKLAPDAVGTYSQGIVYQNVCYFSGQIGINPSTQQLVSGFDLQLAQILENIDGLLESQKLTRRDILKTTIFMVDLNEFSKVNKAYENYFTAPYPARSCVQVPALPKGALIEIEVIAAPCSTVE